MSWPLPHAWHDDFRIAVTQSTNTDGYWNESVFIRAFYSNDCSFCLVGTLLLCAPCSMFCEVRPQRYKMYLPKSYRISTITEVPSTELNIQFSYWLAEYLVVIWIQFVVVFFQMKIATRVQCTRTIRKYITIYVYCMRSSCVILVKMWITGRRVDWMRNYKVSISVEALIVVVDTDLLMM